MGWLDELTKILEAGERPESDPGPPPTFTMGPRPFGVAKDVAGVEWQTDRRTSGVVRYRKAGTEAWTEVVNEARQRDHQRTLAPLTPDTEYEVEVTVIVPKRGATPVTQTLSIRTVSAGAPTHVDEPPETDTGEVTTDTTGGAGGAGAGDPIPHAAGALNVLQDHAVWLPGSLTRVDPAFQAWLRQYCLGGPTKIVVADMKHVPARMRKAGFRGRDTALWYTLSRSYGGWNWTFKGADPDAHLSNQRTELHDFWSNYIDVIKSVMSAVPATTALILENDAEGRCGKTLGAYTERQLKPRGRGAGSSSATPCRTRAWS